MHAEAAGLLAQPVAAWLPIQAGLGGQLAITAANSRWVPAHSQALIGGLIASAPSCISSPGDLSPKTCEKCHSSCSAPGPGLEMLIVGPRLAYKLAQQTRP